MTKICNGGKISYILNKLSNYLSRGTVAKRTVLYQTELYGSVGTRR